MNHEAISQLCFSERFTAQTHQTAATVFAQLPNAACHASRLANVLSTAQLLAQLESICMQALHPHLQWPRERVLGSAVKLGHKAPAVVGETAEMSGFVLGLGERSVDFHIVARVADRLIGEGLLTFAVVQDAWWQQAHRAAAGPAMRGALHAIHAPTTLD